MKSRYFKALAVALLLAVVAAIGVSQTVKRSRMHGDGMFAEGMFGEGMPGTGMHSGHMMRFLARKLDLTDAQQAQTMTELTVQRARVASELLQVLTPDQKAKLTTMINEHEQRFMNRMKGE